MRLPGRDIQTQSLRLQLIAVAVVAGGTELILQATLLAGQILKWQSQPALALVGGIIHRDEQSLVGRPLPREGHKTIVRPVVVPGGSTIGELPLAVANSRLAQNCQQPIVELPEPGIDRLIRRAAQVRRDALLPPLELPLMKEPQARG